MVGTRGTQGTGVCFSKDSRDSTIVVEDDEHRLELRNGQLRITDGPARIKRKSMGCMDRSWMQVERR